MGQVATVHTLATFKVVLQLKGSVAASRCPWTRVGECAAGGGWWWVVSQVCQAACLQDLSCSPAADDSRNGQHLGLLQAGLITMSFLVGL